MSAPRPPYENPEEAAAATYCAALLSSCISETVLADLLTLSPEELLEDPRVIFERAGRIIKAVQMIRRDGSIMLRDFLSEAKRPANTKTLFDALNALPRKDHTIDGWRNIILVAVLLVKRYKLAHLTDAVEDITRKAHDEGKYSDEDDFRKLMAEMMVDKLQIMKLVVR
ncbi:hypothetical protein SLS64_011011 [Diaporthe eres]